MDKLITDCPICETEYDSARFLPCGKTICQKCVVKNSIGSRYDCVYCFVNHDVPKDGFPVNETLEYMIKTLETNFLNRTVLKELQDNIENTETILNEFESKTNNIKQTIHEYFDRLTNEIDLTTEKNIKFLQDSRDKLLKEVNEYKGECLYNLEKSKSSLAFNVSFISSSRNLLNHQKRNLKNIEINDESLKKKNSDINSLKWRLETEMKKIENLAFNNIKVVFNPNDCFKSIGELKKTSQTVIDRKNLSKIDFFSKIKKEVTDFDIELIDNDKYIISFKDKASKTVCVQLHSFYDNLCEIFNEPYDKGFIWCDVTVYQKKILIFMCSNYDKLIILDDKLNKIKEKKINFNLSAPVCTDNKIIAYSMDGKDDAQLVIYDWDLNEIMVIYKKAEFYNFSYNIADLFVNDKFLVIKQVGGILNVLDKSDGRLIKTLKVPDMTLLTDSYIYAFDSKSIKFYDFNGSLVETRELTNFDKAKSSLCIIKNKEDKIFIVDSPDFSLYGPI